MRVGTDHPNLSVWVSLDVEPRDLAVEGMPSREPWSAVFRLGSEAKSNNIPPSARCCCFVSCSKCVLFWAQWRCAPGYALALRPWY